MALQCLADPQLQHGQQVHSFPGILFIFQQLFENDTSQNRSFYNSSDESPSPDTQIWANLKESCIMRSGLICIQSNQ